MMHWSRKIPVESAVAIGILLVLGALSIAYLTVIPRIFFDEATTIEVARNFQLFGMPDILTEPGHFSGFPYITGSSGFPVFLPLAGFFEVFSFGFPQARIYALGWLLGFLVIAWFFVKSFWNASYATGALALVAGFASLHDSGRRVMGDVPGLALLLLGLLFLLKKDKAFLAGIFFGLSVAAKPSVYLLIIPALVLSYIFADWRTSFRKLLPVGAGVALPIALWVVLQFPDPLSLATWQNVLYFYRNAFGSTYSPWASILNNIKSFGSQTTLIYFSLLAIPTLFAFRKKFLEKNILALFLLLYGIFDLLYFLKSTGTIRYLLPLQLLMLLTLPATISWGIRRLQAWIQLFRKIPLRYAWPAVIVALSALHLVQFLFLSSVVAKNTAHVHVLSFLTRYTTETIGVVSSPHIAAFVAPEQKFHYVRMTDQIIFGTNPLSPREELPDVLVIPSDYEEAGMLSSGEMQNLRHYSLVLDERWRVYELRP